jgi:hypothetical protein
MKYLHSAVLGIFIAVTLLLSQAQAGLAQTTGTIEIHKRLCPAGQPTGDIFEDCHDNLVDQTVSFSLDGGAAASVGADGNLVFTDVAAGSHAISEVEGPPLEFVSLLVYCSVQDDDPEVFQVTTDGPNFSVDLEEGQYLVCDVYNLAEDLSGLTPEPTAVATSTPGGIQLPNTGSGMGTGSGPAGFALFALVALLGCLAMIGFGFISRKSGSVRR